MFLIYAFFFIFHPNVCSDFEPPKLLTTKFHVCFMFCHYDIITFFKCF